MTFVGIHFGESTRCSAMGFVSNNQARVSVDVRDADGRDQGATLYFRDREQIEKLEESLIRAKEQLAMTAEQIARDAETACAV